MEFTLKFGEKGRSFGAVTPRDIEQAFEKLGHKIDRRRIRIEEQLKTAGAYTVGVRLHAEVIAKVPVVIRAEQPVVAKAEESTEEGAKKGAAKKRAPRKKKGEQEAAASEGAAAEGTSEAK